MPEITPPTNCPSFFQELSRCTASHYRALSIVPDSALLATYDTRTEEGTFRRCGDAFPSAWLRGAGARTPPGSRAAEGRGGRPGARTHLARGARAGRCVGRGRARGTCTPRSRRLPNGLSSSCTSLTPGPNCDRFKLHIPYAGETLKWDIIFNAQYPELPPDFIFGEDAEFLPDPSALHNLASWNPSNPECLLLVVKELVQQYHQFQCSRLRESSRLMFEYQTLLEEPQYGENMEIYAGKKNNWTGEFSARFLLKLPVDFSNIPTYLLKDVNEDPGEDVALLSVSFEDTEATQVYPKLYLSPRIEHALGGSSALHIPAFPGGGCLIDYVPQVCHLLTNKVQYVIQGYHKRREYIAAFLSHFGTGVVEYDAEGFTKLTLLLMWKDFCFLVHIDLPLFFPRDQPTLTFQSVYHFTNSGQLYSQAQKNYPYSPRWDGNEMAKRAKAYFKTFVPQFQEAAFANGKL
ncbi:BRISC and BRCA1-A complex member 2 isoform X2 [Pteropus medius]|uniref:BRISC and BRCA1-A complex member 2 isoform X2 n=1 Tax=Pteropus vampyrus TaxID=132908 RepID=UPI00196BAA94|nr:BRISC and BRCA1-A complex member 2 isoform X2 [Pteropus giganteus]